MSYDLPAATFDSWPTTRVGALVVDVALLAVAVVLWASPRAMYRASGRGKTAATSSRYRMWGFWVCGLDQIRFVDAQAHAYRRRLNLRFGGGGAAGDDAGGCGSGGGGGRIIINKKDIRGIEVARQPLTLASLAVTLLASCALGLWLHYVPCLWWTCDWTDGDAPLVRCAVWFATWAASFVALSLASRPLALRVAYERGDGYEHELLLAIADGDKYSSGHPKAAADAAAARAAMYRRPETKRDAATQQPVYVP